MQIQEMCIPSGPNSLREKSTQSKFLLQGLKRLQPLRRFAQKLHTFLTLTIMKAHTRRLLRILKILVFRDLLLHFLRVPFVTGACTEQSECVVNGLGGPSRQSAIRGQITLTAEAARSTPHPSSGR